MGKSSLTRKVWIAMSTPFQVNFFAPLIKKFEERFDFLITARNHDRIFSLLEAMDLEYVPVGRHGGTERDGKLEAYAETVQQLIPVVKKEKPDLLLTERWPEAVRVAFGLDIPAWTLFYDEREYHVNRMVFPLSSRVFAPSFYRVDELRSNGVDPDSIVWFSGFHTCYLKEENMVGHRNPFLENGYKSPIVLVRPEPEFACFFGNRECILEEAVSVLSNAMGVKDEFSIVVFPRTESQVRIYEKYPVVLMNDALADNPVAHADVTLGAAETMLMESFVLGKPAVSTVYWEESKPLTQLHRFIPHTTDPKEAASQVLYYLDPKVREDFRLKAEKIVSIMGNPITEIKEEIEKFYDKNSGKKEKASRTRRRSRIQIYADILRSVAFRPLKITHIMQVTNISHSKAKKNVIWLIKKGLMREIDRGREERFRITTEGLDVLSSYEKIEDKLM